MAKYEPLHDFLKKQNREVVRLTFSDIEKLIGAPLPPSARKHRPWWSNNPKNSVITNAWLKAGFRTEQVNIHEEKLTFRRAGRQPDPEAAASKKPGEFGGQIPRHPLFGVWKGFMQIAPGVDLTEPADPDWGKDN